MTTNEFINEVSIAQRRLNDLLIGAYQHNIKYMLSINNVNCKKDDDRQAVGIKMFNNLPIYSSDGTP